MVGAIAPFQLLLSKLYTQLSSVFVYVYMLVDRLCGLVARVLATDPEVPGSIPGATRFSDK
jgi:hypothetical protein